MKRAPLRFSGAIVSFLVGAVVQTAAAGDLRAAATRGQSPQPDANEKTRSAVDVPRGNLRGDIANNARSRPDTPRGGADDRPHENNRPGSR